MSRIFATLMMLFALPLNGCSGDKTHYYSSEIIITEQSSTSQEMQQTIAVGDPLTIRIFGEDNLSGIYIVQPDMTLSVPLLGIVDIRDMDADMIADHLAHLYQRADILRRPDIQVERGT